MGHLRERHLTFCQNVCQRSETKGFRNSFLQHVNYVHGSLLLPIPRGFFLLLSFYIHVVISWNITLFKAWSEDKLNKKIHSG